MVKRGCERLGNPSEDEGEALRGRILRKGKKKKVHYRREKTGKKRNLEASQTWGKGESRKLKREVSQVETYCQKASDYLEQGRGFTPERGGAVNREKKKGTKTSA